jgi:hypothetical protein
MLRRSKAGWRTPKPVARTGAAAGERRLRLSQKCNGPGRRDHQRLSGTTRAANARVPAVAENSIWQVCWWCRQRGSARLPPQGDRAVACEATAIAAAWTSRTPPMAEAAASPMPPNHAQGCGSDEHERAWRQRSGP